MQRRTLDVGAAPSVEPDQRGRRDPARVLCTPLLLLGLIVAVLVGPSLVPGDPNAVRMGMRLLPPGPGGLVGTDALGRSVALRLLHGGRLAVGIGLVAVGASLVLALSVATIAVVAGRLIDAALCAVMDVLLSLPGLLVTLAVLGLLRPGTTSLIVALLAASWAGDARVLRSVALGCLTSGYVEAARSLGATGGQRIRFHVLPAMLTTATILGSLHLAEILLVVSGLSFLGLGAQPPAADWGSMLADGRTLLARAPWISTSAGLCIVVFSFLASLSGDALRARFDPHARTERT